MVIHFVIEYIYECLSFLIASALISLIDETRSTYRNYFYRSNLNMDYLMENLREFYPVPSILKYAFLENRWAKAKLTSFSSVELKMVVRSIADYLKIIASISMGFAPIHITKIWSLFGNLVSRWISQTYSIKIAHVTPDNLVKLGCVSVRVFIHALETTKISALFIRIYVTYSTWMEHP